MFLLRTTTMPSVTKLLELERLVMVDTSGQNIANGPGAAKACIVGESLQGPFVPTVINSPGDLEALYVGTGNASRFTLISQSGLDPSSAVQNGSGVAYDGNLWAELKGKRFSGLVVQRVDCDMVAAIASSTAKVFVKFDVTVASADQTAGVTNKDLYIPSGTRFADTSIGSATNVIATSQLVRIPAGTTVVANTITCGVNFTQDAATGILTYVASGATTGVTAFFVKGVKGLTTFWGGVTAIDTAVDTAVSGGSTATVISGTISIVDSAGTAAAAYPPCAGGAAPTSDTLSNRIMACYAPAIEKTKPGIDATNDIVAIWSARNYQTSDSTLTASQMRTNLWSNAVSSSKGGRGRVACVTNQPSTGTLASDATTRKSAYQSQIASTDTSVVGDDADRYWLSGPFVNVFSTELNANIMISSCGFRACMKVALANAGQSQFLSSVGTPYNDSIQGIDSQEACFAANPAAEDDYVALKSKGVSWLTRDRNAGWWFYSGVTGVSAVTNSSRVDDNRRSFADEIQDVIFGFAAKYAKLPGTQERQDAFLGDMQAYLDGLVNPGIGESRAKQFQALDGAAAGNTDTLNGQGIFLYSVSVQMYGSQKAIVVNAAIGTNVVITQAA